MIWPQLKTLPKASNEETNEIEEHISDLEEPIEDRESTDSVEMLEVQRQECTGFLSAAGLKEESATQVMDLLDNWKEGVILSNGIVIETWEKFRTADVLWALTNLVACLLKFHPQRVGRSLHMRFR